MAIQIFDALTGREKIALPGCHNRVNSITFSPDGATLASGSEDNAVRIWHIGIGEVVRQLAGHQGAVHAVVFSPNGQLLASGSEDHTIRLWRVADGAEVACLAGHQGRVTSLAFAPDGRLLASGSQDTSVRLWDVASGGRIAQLQKHQGSVEGIAFAPDGATLASASWDRTIRLWDVARLESLQKLVGHTGGVKTVAFSPGVRILASGAGDRTIILWDLATGRKLRQLAGHEGVVLSLAFSPGGKELASGSEDRTVRLWDPATGREARRLPENQGLVTAVAFSPDGQHLACVNAGFTSILFRKRTDLRPEAPPSVTPAPLNIEKLWDDLASADTRTAFGATRLLAGVPQLAMPLFRAKLRPLPPINPERIGLLIADLASDDARARDWAAEGLLRLGHPAESALRQALARRPPPALQQSCEALLERLRSTPPSADSVRELRAVGVLLKIKSTASRQLLEMLAQGDPEAMLTQEAKVALNRLTQPAGAK